MRDGHDGYLVVAKMLMDLGAEGPTEDDIQRPFPGVARYK